MSPRAGRVVAFVLGALWGWVFYGVIDLFVFLQGPEFHDSFQLETGWGLFFLVLVAVPLLGIAASPSRCLPAAVQQVLLAAVAVAVGAVLSRSPKHLWPAAGVAATALVVAALTGGVRSLRPRPRSLAPVPAVLVVVAAGPWCGYALHGAANARAGRHPDITWSLTHWPIQAALGVGIVLIAANAASRPPGWVVPAWTSGFCSVWLGVTSVVYPDLDASLGRVMGLAAIIWGLAFIAAMHLARDPGPGPATRTPRSSPRSSP